MYNTKTIAINRRCVIILSQFAILLCVATLAPLFHNQPITGPIVNATLFLGAVLLGSQNAMLIGLIPSLIALSVGMLPPALSPMVPFIMLSNAILILVFALLKNKNFWLAVISSSAAKFLFLYSTSFVVINLIAQKPVAQKAAAMLSWPQLATALAGGVIAWLVLKTLKRY